MRFFPPGVAREEVQIGPFKYDIRIDPETLARVRVEAGQTEATGFCCRKRQLIVVDPAQGADQFRETVWHEIKHAIWGMVHLPPVEASEEWVISAQSPSELDVLRRNPGLAEWLLQSR